MFDRVPMAVDEINLAAGGSAPATCAVHRLGWFLASQDEDADRFADAIAKACGTSPEWLERVLLEGVMPEDSEREAIAMATAGFVLIADWTQAGPGDWRKRPALRPVGVAA